MASIDRLARTGLLAAILAAVALGTGCSQHHSPLADLNTPLPPGVSLPPGFHPLGDHYNPDNPNDHYNGWPRYIICEKDNMVMAYVPSQTFTMGGGTAPDEVPARQAEVSHFYIDVHEVTNGQFHRFAKAAAWKSCRQHDAYREYFVCGVNNDHPVRNVSWIDARYYCKWAGRMLPTEAQWEAAARGDDRRVYPWGNQTQSETTRYLCNCRTDRAGFDGYEYTAPAMNFAAGVSPYGAFQMSGNVAEWCADWYDPGRAAYPSEEDPGTGLQRGAREFGDVNYPNPLQKMIREARVGPLRGDEKAVRGGSFCDPIERCRVDSRMAARPGAYQADVGFRGVVVLPPEEPRG